MKVLHTRNEMLKEISRLRFVEAPVLLNVVEKLASADVLHRDAKVRIRYERLFELHDERVAQRAVIDDLPSNVIGDLIPTRDQFHRVTLVTAFVAHEFRHAVRAGP